eukprot:gene40105-48872_t
MEYLENLANKLAKNEVDGSHLASLVEKGEITKQERRKITKISKAIVKESNLTKRQLERRAVKEKKKLPKLTNEDRKRKYHEMLEEQREQEAAKFTVCLGCRKRGHFLKDCPKAASRNQDASIYCFNCGSHDHTLKNCPEERDRSGRLPFAKCFVCKAQGHLSRDCPENANGLYPKGGCCHICFQKNHLARDCPEKPKEAPIEREAAMAEEVGARWGAVSLEEPKDKVVSGDALLGDDFAGYDDVDEETSKKHKKKKHKKSSA